MNRIEYLLTCLTEECAEVQKLVSKSLRFGLDDRHPASGRTSSNREELEHEIIDILAIIEMLRDDEVLNVEFEMGDVERMLETKKNKVLHFMNYSREKGTLHD